MLSFMNSMTARIFLILVGGTVLSGALVLALAQFERKELAAQFLAHRAADRIEQAILALEAVPPASRPVLAAFAERSDIRIGFTETKPGLGKPVETEFSVELAQIMGNSRPISVFEGKGADCPARLGRHGRVREERFCQTVFTHLQDGTPVRFDLGSRNPGPPPLHGRFLFNMIVFLAGISMLALFVAYIATKPLRKLEQAARDFGKNIRQQPLPENQGPREVRQAAQAFNSMQTSIHNHIQERTFMLAAIAHDLQTPLTRLRLRLEKVENEELRAQLVADLTASQTMIREGLEFARNINDETPFELVDVDSLIEAICNDATDAGCNVTYSGKIGKPILANPGALRHCIGNLLDNALKFGKRARVEVNRENDKAFISVIDDGPGIPAEQLEEVFQPFKRMESSRSRTSGGTGLGLTIARIIAEKHRGSIKLSNLSPAGSGLQAVLALPVTD